MKLILLPLFSLYAVFLSAQLTLRHAIIEGTENNQLGYSVALANDGNTLAVGAPFANNATGIVQIYRDSPTQWTSTNQERFVGAANQQFGLSLNLSTNGNHLVIGNDGPSPLVDSVRTNTTFERVANRWSNILTVFPTRRASDRCCSGALSDNGLRIVVGAPRFNFASVANRLGNSWSFVPGRLELSGAMPNSFSTSAAISGDGSTIFLAEIPDSPNVLIGGTVKAFRLSGEWEQLGKLIFGSGQEMIGEALATTTDGSTVAMTVNDTHATGQGSVRVYQLSGEDWLLRGDPIRSTTLLGGRFGQSVALSADGNRLVVGSPTTDAEGSLAGQVDLYEWDGNAWQLIATETAFTGPNSQFGYSVDISPSGNTIAVGANLATVSGEERAGLAAVYDYAPLTSSSQPQELPVSVISEPGAFRINPATTLTEAAEVFVFDTNGRQVTSWRLPRQEQLTIRHQLPRGIYFLRFTAGRRMNTVKVLAQ